ncbi:hypothetical protein NE237_024849 [Protea cynaroides]|uniref:Uncharacterized protein n=1 Tax=Protea cynaroides TaxID=273540 RepID=A0A9Q0K166_9MAGN|nr:hypothetical protein NE237_024849 [Protea cynaroides]
MVTTILLLYPTCPQNYMDEDDKSSIRKKRGDLEVDYESEKHASMVYAALAVDKELQPDKVKRLMLVSDGKLSDSEVEWTRTFTITGLVNARALARISSTIPSSNFSSESIEE